MYRGEIQKRTPKKNPFRPHSIGGLLDPINQWMMRFLKEHGYSHTLRREIEGDHPRVWRRRPLLYKKMGNLWPYIQPGRDPFSLTMDWWWMAIRPSLTISAREPKTKFSTTIPTKEDKVIFFSSYRLLHIQFFLIWVEINSINKSISRLNLPSVTYDLFLAYSHGMEEKKRQWQDLEKRKKIWWRPELMLLVTDGDRDGWSEAKTTSSSQQASQSGRIGQQTMIKIDNSILAPCSTKVLGYQSKMRFRLVSDSLEYLTNDRLSNPTGGWMTWKDDSSSSSAASPSNGKSMEKENDDEEERVERKNNKKKCKENRSKKSTREHRESGMWWIRCCWTRQFQMDGLNPELVQSEGVVVAQANERAAPGHW